MNLKTTFCLCLSITFCFYGKGQITLDQEYANAATEITYSLEESPKQKSQFTYLLQQKKAEHIEIAPKDSIYLDYQKVSTTTGRDRNGFHFERDNYALKFKVGDSPYRFLGKKEAILHQHIKSNPNAVIELNNFRKKQKNSKIIQYSSMLVSTILISRQIRKGKELFGIESYMGIGLFFGGYYARAIMHKKSFNHIHNAVDIYNSSLK